MPMVVLKLCEAGVKLFEVASKMDEALPSDTASTATSSTSEVKTDGKRKLKQEQG